MEKITVDDNTYFGINYYHESMGYTEWKLEDLQKIKEITNKIKLFKHPYGERDYIIEICQKCKELGFYVVFTENFDGNTNPPPYPNSLTVSDKLTLDNWESYCSNVKTDFSAVCDYVDEFLVSNEITIHTDGSDEMSGQNLIDKVILLKNELGSEGSVVFGIQEGCWTFLYGNPLDLSAFTKKYFTLYDYEEEVFRQIVEQMVNIYPDAELGEWNVGFDIEHNTQEELEDWSERIEKRKEYLMLNEINNYIFTFGYDTYQKLDDPIVLRKISKKYHYCDHDQDIRNGCRIEYEFQDN